MHRSKFVDCLFKTMKIFVSTNFKKIVINDISFFKIFSEKLRKDRVLHIFKDMKTIVYFQSKFGPILIFVRRQIL